MADDTSRCPDSYSTMKSVERCPNSKESWDKAATRKGCHKMYDKCTDGPEEGMEYHCLFNQSINGTVEVCVSAVRIDGGFCPEYNPHLGKIERNVDVKCEEIRNPFRSFSSRLVYKFPLCYREIEMIERRMLSATKTDFAKPTDSCLKAIFQGNDHNMTELLPFEKNFLPLHLTMEYVESCPDSKKAWDKAAIRKRCDQISLSCIGQFEKDNLEYHCVINADMNATVEVCAPVRRIFGGFCPEFSARANAIQPNYATNCTQHRESCRLIFNSTDTYEYPGCYEEVRRGKKQPLIATTSSQRDMAFTTDVSQNHTVPHVSLIFTAIGSTIAVAVISLLIILLIGILFKYVINWKETHQREARITDARCANFTLLQQGDVDEDMAVVIELDTDQ